MGSRQAQSMLLLPEAEPTGLTKQWVKQDKRIATPIYNNHLFEERSH